MFRVFVVDDNEIVRLGVTYLIDSHPELVGVGVCGSAAQAPARITAADADVVILEANLPDGSGMDLCRAIRAARPRTRCLIFTADEESESLKAATLAGASGYVLKRAHRAAFVDSILRVAHGEPMQPTLDRALPSSVISQNRTLAVQQPPLSLREYQVLRLIAEGMTNREIGLSLDLAEKTVKNYVSGLLAKLGFQRRTQAAVYGATHGHTRDNVTMLA
jgi:two-component system, NarL family, response regulator DevR